MTKEEIVHLDHRHPLLDKERQLRAIIRCCKDIQHDITDSGNPHHTAYSGFDVFNILENIVSLAEDSMP